MKKKIGIALGGGGAKGFAHIGVLSALTSAGINFDLVAGTSIGALVGAAYASGSLDSLEKISKKLGVTDIPFLLGPTWPSKGLFSGNYIERLLNEVIRVENIEELGKPFAAVCVDLNRAEIVTFTEGSLVRAVRASMSIPGLFTPVILGDKLLVDGGVLEPVPVKALHELGAELVVAVDLLSNLSSSGVPGGKAGASFADYIRSVAEKFYMEDMFSAHGGESKTGLSLIEIVQKSSVAAQRRLTEYNFRENPPDLIIDPPLSHVKVFDFHRGESIMKTGRETAEKAVPALLELIGDG
ncbi:MAG: patatin-like phospholipase family protein [Deltaproteobacteria bacterium]